MMIMEKLLSGFLPISPKEALDRYSGLFMWPKMEVWQTHGCQTASNDFRIEFLAVKILKEFLIEFVMQLLSV